MPFTFQVVLRPGADDVVHHNVASSTEAEGAIDEWIRANGREGDEFSWTRQGPNAVGAGDYGGGTVAV